MTEIVLADTARFEEADQVMRLYTENVSVSQIARTLDIKRADVLAHIDEWKQTVKANRFLQDRVEELLHLTNEHYSILIRKAYEIIDEVDTSGATLKEKAAMLGQKNTALKSIAEFEAKRIDMLQKAGLLEAADLGDEFADQERKVVELMSIIREVTNPCDHCRPEVNRRLAIMLKQPVATVMEDQPNDVVEAEIVE